MLDGGGESLVLMKIAVSPPGETIKNDLKDCTKKSTSPCRKDLRFKDRRISPTPHEVLFHISLFELYKEF